MAILHTGQGFYKDAGIGFNPAEFVKQVGDDQVKLEEYRQKLQMQWEQEFLKMTSVDMENLVFDQFQLEAKKLYDKFMDESTQIWKGKKGVLSTEDKMKVIRSQQAIQGQVSMMKSKAKQYLEVKDTLEKDGGYRYDPALMKEEMDNFVKDPLNNPVPTLKARPVDLVQHMLKDAPKWKQDATEKYVEIGTGQYEKHMERERFGIKTEEDLRAWAKEKLKQDQVAGYSFSSPYWERNFEGLIEQLKPEMLPYPFQRTSISASLYNLNTGGGKGLSYTVEEYGDIGKAINITGNFPPMTLQTADGSKQVVVTSIGAKGIMGSYETEEMDTSVEGVEATGAHAANLAKAKLEGKGIKANKVQQASNGKWYPVFTKRKNATIETNTPESRNNYNIIYNAAQENENINRDKFNKAWSLFSPSLNEVESNPPESIARPNEEVTAVEKGKAVPSQPKKQIKRGDIKAKAKAAGYSEAEYTEMLKKNNIEIVD